MSEKNLLRLSIGLAVVGVVIIAMALIARVTGFRFKKVFGLQTAKINCNKNLIETKPHTMQDGFLRGIVDSGETVDIAHNYYQCFDVERGDVVLLSFSSSHDPVLRVVRGISGDHVELVQDTQHQGWNVKVNNNTIMFYEDMPYYLGTDKRTPILQTHLDLLEKSVIGSDKLLVLSTVPRGRSDSGTFGLIPIENLIGKAILPKKE